MTTPTNPSYTEDFVLPTDKENPTVFHLGMLDTLLRVHIDDAHTTLTRILTGTKMSDADMHHKYLEMVRFGLRGWTNFKDASGLDVPFETEKFTVPKVGERLGISDTCLNHIDIVDIMAIGIQLSKMNTVSRADRKN
jgi:hypothetical protein